jgi:hypothetical protein
VFHPAIFVSKPSRSNRYRIKAKLTSQFPFYHDPKNGSHFDAARKSPERRRVRLYCEVGIYYDVQN